MLVMNAHKTFKTILNIFVLYHIVYSDGLYPPISSDARRFKVLAHSTKIRVFSSVAGVMWTATQQSHRPVR